MNEIKKYLNFDLLACNKETWFQDIFQLQPSHFLKITKNNIRIRKYYKIEDHIDESKDENKASLKNEQKKLFKALELSFKQHSIYDVKEGVFTSGGADSALLLALSKNIRKKINTFTFNFKEKNLVKLMKQKN